MPDLAASVPSDMDLRNLKLSFAKVMEDRLPESIHANVNATGRPNFPTDDLTYYVHVEWLQMPVGRGEPGFVAVNIHYNFDEHPFGEEPMSVAALIRNIFLVENSTFPIWDFVNAADRCEPDRAKVDGDALCFYVREFEADVAQFYRAFEAKEMGFIPVRFTVYMWRPSHP
jgi:hypothetical protein